MTENTPFDFVWLGLLIGTFDLGDGGMGSLRDQLEDMGLTATKAKLPALEEDWRDANIESDAIAGWVGRELTEKGVNSPYMSGIDLYDSTNLIKSMRPAVWANVPRKSQNDFVDADKSIRNSQFDAGALQLVRGVETMMIHFYEQLLPTADKNLRWSDMEDALFKIGDRELLPTLFFIKGFRKDYRNPTAHGDKEYDVYETIGLWHMSMQAVTRMAVILERRSPLPGSA